MKTFIFIVVVALLGLVGYRHGYLKPEWVGIGEKAGAPAPGAKGAAGGSLQDTLNVGLPRMVGNDISLDRAIANNLLVSFEYRIVDLDQYGVAQRYGTTLPADMQSRLISDLCLVRAVREQVLAQGRDVQMQIRAQDGRTMYTSQIRPGGC